jgi:ADP-ribose pyrophosphatase
MDEPFPLFHPADPAGWQTLTEETLLENPHAHVQRVTLHTPQRPSQSVPWIIVRRKAAVAIAAYTADKKYLLIQQERLPVKQTCWEFPAGQIDCAAEEITHQCVVETALRELAEETGFTPAPGAQIQPLGYFFPSQGFTDEHVYLFHIGPVQLTQQVALDEHERISPPTLLSWSELTQRIAHGSISTALTLALYARLSARQCAIHN